MIDIAAVDLSVKQPDELSFVDEDIRELFEGCSYVMGMPLMAQLIKELRLLRQLGEEKPAGIPAPTPTQQLVDGFCRWLKSLDDPYVDDFGDRILVDGDILKAKLGQHLHGIWLSGHFAGWKSGRQRRGGLPQS